MKTILWMYEKDLNPQDGGTERISYLIMNGLKERGYSCLGFLEFHKNTGEIIYHKNLVKDLYAFLIENKIDIVINQLGYGDWLLKRFYNEGGERWNNEGGKIITCLHFDPKQPQKTRQVIFHNWRTKSSKEKIDAIKRYLLSPYYDWKEENSIRNIYKYLYDYSDLFVMLSKTHFPYFKSLLKFNDYSKLRAIPNPLTFPDISSLEIINNKKKQILVVARMSEYHKRISIVLKVWKKLINNFHIDDWNLIIVGEGPDLNKYKEYVLYKKIRNVNFVGQQNPDPYYKEASIFLLTSSAEGWGLTLTEAMQRGVVSIVMESSPVFRDIINDGFTGYIVPNNNIDLFIEKVLFLINNEKQRILMSKNCLEESKKFDLNSTLNLWEKLIIN